MVPRSREVLHEIVEAYIETGDPEIGKHRLNSSHG